MSGRFQLTPPTVHLNGTSRDALQKAYADAYAAVSEAIAVVCGSAPNARDYYVQARGAFDRACDEHQRRLDMLASVRDQLLELHDACDEGAQQLRLPGGEQ